MSRVLRADGDRSDDRDTSKPIVHLVYPHGPQISTPDAIGRHLGARLAGRFRVVQHDWTARGVIEPGNGDVLLGHPHPLPSTIFRQSARRPGWRRVLMLSPFSADLRQVAFVDDPIKDCDLYLAVTGEYWFDGLDASIFSHWAPKMRRIDLAVDRADFPAVKTAFNPPGRRRLVYIGHRGHWKNTGYLSEIATHLPGVDIAWIGANEGSITGLRSLGWQDFSTPDARRLVAGFDFMVTVGSSDANPTTILEAMAWGLIPICTPQSGYAGVPGIVNVPLGDSRAAAHVIRQWLECPEEQLVETQRANWALLDRDYTWDRFAESVITAIESDDSPPLGPESAARRAQFVIAEGGARGVRTIVRASRRGGRLLRRGLRGPRSGVAAGG